MKILTKFFLVSILINFYACSSTLPQKETASPTIQITDVVAPGDKIAIDDNQDPWQSYNRWMYDFNAKFDRYIFLPAVEVYKEVLPKPVRTSIHNAFGNLRDFGNLGNSLLQAKPKQSGRIFSRILINSTIGLAGLFDPATSLGLYKQNEDFGQTLGKWGVGPGPYLVLPILGPSTLRDAPGSLLDRFYHPIYLPNNWLIELDTPALIMFSAIDAKDTRANIGFEYYSTGSPFEYIWVRSLWLEHRKLEVLK